MKHRFLTDEDAAAVAFVIGYFTPQLIRLLESPSATVRFAVTQLLDMGGITHEQLIQEHFRRGQRAVG